MRCVAVSLPLAVLFAASATAEDGNVPLKTEIPEEVLVGTPPDVLALLFPGLEKPPTGKQPDFLVPAGTVNLALRKPVTSSDTNPVIGRVELATDGTKDGSEEAFVELAPGLQWIQVDLGRKSTIHAIYLWHYFREARSYHDTIVQVADDLEFKQGVQTLFNTDTDNSSRLGIGKDRPYIDTNLGRLIDAKGVQGRYVRLYSSGNTANDLNHYVEVEVFGKPPG